MYWSDPLTLDSEPVGSSEGQREHSTSSSMQVLLDGEAYQNIAMMTRDTTGKYENQ